MGRTTTLSNSTMCVLANANNTCGQSHCPPLRELRREVRHVLFGRVPRIVRLVLLERRRRLALPVIALPLAPEPLALAREVPFAGAADTVVL